MVRNQASLPLRQKREVEDNNDETITTRNTRARMDVDDDAERGDRNAEIDGESYEPLQETADSIAVAVLVPGGYKISLPVSQTTSVAQLHSNTILRANQTSPERFTVHNSGISTLGGHCAFTSGPTLVVDVLNATHENRFSLQMLDTLSTNASLEQNLSEVSVRLISAKLALQHNYLEDIPPQPVAIGPLTSLSALRSIAARLLPSEGLNSDMTEVVMFTAHHCLPCTDDGIVLKDLGILDNKPLNIYVSFAAKDASSGEINARRPGRNISYSWAFDTTDRGIATFMTCTKALFHAIAAKKINLQDFLVALWEVTHFSPACLAFAEIYREREFRASPARPWAVFAHSFNALCTRMVPSWVTDAGGSPLEASRQVFAWLCSLQPSVPRPPDGSLQIEVVKIELTVPGEDGLPPATQSSLPFYKLVRTSSATCQTGASPITSRIGTEKPLRAASRGAVALALTNRSTKPWKHCFDCTGEPCLDLLAHDRRARPTPNDFKKLLKATNLNDALQCVHPMLLENVPIAALPVVTLSGEGFLSLYDQEDEVCGERFFYTWNAINGQQKLPADAGQTLFQKLAPIIEQRKADGTWALDAWADGLLIESSCQEAVVVCVDCSISMSASMPKEWSTMPEHATEDGLSRLSEVTALFSNFMARLSALKVPTHLGLLSFCDIITVHQGISPVLLNFHDKLDNVDAGGTTAIWNAVGQARGMLTSYRASKIKADGRAKESPPRLRIVLLTDGEDNMSTKDPEEVCRGLIKDDVVLDAIVIGTDATADLFRVAKHTGGYAFAPDNRDLCFQIPLLETFVDIAARPDTTRVSLLNWDYSLPKERDMASLYEVPPRRPHAHQDGGFFPVTDYARQARSGTPGTARGQSGLAREIQNLQIRTPSTSASSTSVAGTPSSPPGAPSLSPTPRSLRSARRTHSASSSSTPGVLTPTTSSPRSVSRGRTPSSSVASGGTRPLHDEIVEVHQNPHQDMDVYVAEQSMAFWKVVMRGPSGSPYAGGTFLLTLDLGDGFPARPPKARFLTPMLHPNITKQGLICHPIFDREWRSDIRAYQVLQHVYMLLLSFEERDTIDPLLTEDLWSDPVARQTRVLDFVQNTATKSRAEWRHEILGHDDAVLPTVEETPTIKDEPMTDD